MPFRLADAQNSDLLEFFNNSRKSVLSSGNLVHLRLQLVVDMI